MSVLTLLRTYAKTVDLSLLPPTVLFVHTPTSLAIFDKYAKAKFHFLVLPRLPHREFSTNELASLQSLLANPKKKDAAKSLLVGLKQDAQAVRERIEQEMIKRFQYKWDIWIGFHAVPSMQHVHLHVISSDLCSQPLKTKKHYNSFHPKVGFFLHIDEVLSWFDAEPSFYDSMAALKANQYEHLLKDDLSCWRCYIEFKNVPQLKDHLQEEWDNEARRGKKTMERKRKREEEINEDDPVAQDSTSEFTTEPDSKRQQKEQ